MRFSKNTWPGDVKAVCPRCLKKNREGLRLSASNDCKTCFGTRRDMIPWTELFKEIRQWQRS